MIIKNGKVFQEDGSYKVTDLFRVIAYNCKVFA